MRTIRALLARLAELRRLRRVQQAGKRLAKLGGTMPDFEAPPRRRDISI